MRARLTCAMFFFCTCSTSTVHGDVEHQTVVDDLALHAALLERVAVWRRSDGPVYVSHCRRASEGCTRRIGAFARMFVSVGSRYRIDPYLIAAMAMRESGLNPDARGSIGEFGLLQLHPYSAAGMRARMVCKRAPSDCTRAIVDEATRHLAAQIARCGNLERALTAYNRGVCRAPDGDDRYARQVLRELARLSQ
jgi:hypothetical protein